MSAPPVPPKSGNIGSDLPPGDYAYVMEGSTLCPCLVLRRGWFYADVLRFEVFRGTKRKRIRRSRLLPVEQTNAVLAFRNDPMAVLHMTGEKPGGIGKRQL